MTRGPSSSHGAQKHCCRAVGPYAGPSSNRHAFSRRSIFSDITFQAASSPPQSAGPARAGEGRIRLQSYRVARASMQTSIHDPKRDHLVVLVNGLFGSPLNWKNLIEHVLPRSDGHVKSAAVVHVSTASSRAATFEGVAACGHRLADEVRSLARANPDLKRISFVGHSMGGLIARHAAGVLLDPSRGTMAGLAPCHLVTMATPHMGVDATHGSPHDLPVLEWLGRFPGVSLLLQPVRALSPIVARAAIGLAGSQFLWADGGDRQQPLLYRMTLDHPNSKEYFYSALCAFRTRTTYANTGEDHLVAWAGASIRDASELPVHKKGARVDNIEPIVLASGNGKGGAAVAVEGRGGEGAAVLATKGGSTSTPLNGSSSAALVGSSIIHEDRPACAFWETDPARVHACGGGSAVGWRSANWASLSVSRLCTQPRGVDGGAACTPGACASPDDAKRGLKRPLPPGTELAELRRDAFLRLRSLPWRRVDVEFRGAPLCAHNDVQGTWRWLKVYGLTVPLHMVRELDQLEQALAAGSEKEPQAAQ